MPLRPFVLVLALACAAPAFADEAAPSPSPSPSVQPSPPFDPREVTTVNNFGRSHPECQEWSDGCLVCRHAAADTVNCSLPGIACQPADIVCKAP